MAKRDPRHSALRGYQVWRWQEQGILAAKPLYDTMVLVVQEAARVRLDRKYRTTVSQGIFLVPRWIKAPKDVLKKFSRLSEEKLKEKGIIKEGDVFYLRIYQQVEDLDHLLRQQYHILFDGKRTRAFDTFIKSEIEARKKAVLQLKRHRAGQLRVIRERNLAPLLKLLRKPEQMTFKVTMGAIRYLDGVIDELDGIIERPLVTRRKRAQRSLRAVQRQLRKRNFYLARKRLEKALENLNWPKEQR